MTRTGDDIGGYEPGGGYRPSPAFSVRAVLRALLLVAAWVAAAWLLGALVGETRARDTIQVAFFLFLGAMGARDVLDPLRGDEYATEAERRSTRLWAMALLVGATAAATLYARHLLFAPE